MHNDNTNCKFAGIWLLNYLVNGKGSLVADQLDYGKMYPNVFPIQIAPHKSNNNNGALAWEIDDNGYFVEFVNDKYELKLSTSTTRAWRLPNDYEIDKIQEVLSKYSNKPKYQHLTIKNFVITESFPFKNIKEIKNPETFGKSFKSQLVARDIQPDLNNQYAGIIRSHTQNHKLAHVEGLVSYGYAFFTIDPQMSQPPPDKRFKRKDVAQSYPHLCYRLARPQGAVDSTVCNLCISYICTC